jgi:8-oxo-dGTP pyrophosphatase MutT (NUDIX family)
MGALDLASVVAKLAAKTAAMPEHASVLAAVSAVLRKRPYDGTTELLFIVRAKRDGDPWSGHVAFPGGRRDAVDSDLRATAIRETREELGLDLTADATLVSSLPDVPAIARGKHLGMVVRPFVFALRGAPTIAPNHEVAEVLWTPLDRLVRRENAATLRYPFEGSEIELPCIHLGPHVLWGLTLKMVEDLVAALAA